MSPPPTPIADDGARESIVPDIVQKTPPANFQKDSRGAPHNGEAGSRRSKLIQLVPSFEQGCGRRPRLVTRGGPSNVAYPVNKVRLFSQIQVAIELDSTDSAVGASGEMIGSAGRTSSSSCWISASRDICSRDVDTLC
jgi:hypothetical protein